MSYQSRFRLKNLAVILSALLALTALTSCSAAKTADDTTPQTEQTTAETTAYDEYASLPSGDYNGEEFNILVTPSNYAIIEMDSEALTGDVINDIIFNRNSEIENSLNVKISQLVTKEYSDAGNLLTKNIAANDDTYEIAFLESNIASKFAMEGSNIDILTVPNIDVSSPWWDQNSLESLTLNDKLYFIYGDLHLQRYEALYTIIFNKDIVTDYSLDNPYDLVNGGSWTLDTFFGMASSISADLNNDGAWDAQNDMFGLIAVTNQPIYYEIGCGERFSETDSNGNISYLGLNDRKISIFEKIAPVLSNKNITMTGSTKGVSSYANDIYSAFENNKSLFLIEVMGRVKELRAMDANFGLLPFPKYDETQTDYISGIAFSAGLMVIPVTNSSLDMTGTVVENMAALSRRDLIPAYYEINLKGKQLRDDDSEKMLDLMTGNIQYDLALIYNWGDIVSTFNNNATNNKELPSAFAKIESKILDGIDVTQSAFESVNN